jgi:hypothetical protein
LNLSCKDKRRQGNDFKQTGQLTSDLSNPFRIGPDGDRVAVIAKYECWLADQHQLLRTLDELRGGDLISFCAPRPCHGDLLLRLANATREERIAWWRAVKEAAP